MISVLIALFVEVVPVELRVQTDALPRAEAVQLFRAVERRFRRQLGITLDLVSVESVPPSYVPDSLAYWENYITAFQTTSRWNKSRMVVAIAPPVYLAGATWLGGAAVGICTYPNWQSFAVVSASAFKRYASEIVLAHELAHLLGADHGSGIMHPDAGALVTAGRRLRFSKRSRGEIHECLGGYG